MRYALVVTDPLALSAGDTAKKGYIETAGHVCVPTDVDDPAVPTIVEDPVNGFHGVVQGHTTVFNTFGPKYTGWAGGVIMFSFRADFGLGSTGGTEASQTTIQLTFGEHVAAGKVGNGNRVTSASGVFSTILPANLATGALPLGKVVGNTERCLIVCETGAALISGNAAGPKVHAGFLNPDPAGWTAEGQARFIDLIEWMGEPRALIDDAVWTEYSVGATARDFATMATGADSAFGRITSANGDILAQNLTLYLTPYNDAPFDEHWLILSADGWVTDATRRIVIEPVGANRYLGVPGQCVRLQPQIAIGVGDDFSRCDVRGTRFGSLEIDGSLSPDSSDGGDNSSSLCKWNADDVEVHNLYIHDGFISNRNRLLSTILGTNKKFWNIEVSAVRRGSNPGNDCSAIRMEVPAGGTAWLYNFTARDSEDMGLEIDLLAGASLVARNGTVTECAGNCVDVGAGGAGDTDYVSTEDGTAPGANSDTGVDPLTEFAGQVPNTADYFTLAAAAVGRATGDDLGSGEEASVDITGATRPTGAWDRAARQGVAIPGGSGGRRSMGIGISIGIGI
jgi:hypothetical protein